MLRDLFARYPCMYIRETSQGSGGRLRQRVQESIRQFNTLIVYVFESFLHEELLLDVTAHDLMRLTIPP